MENDEKIKIVKTEAIVFKPTKREGVTAAKLISADDSASQNIAIVEIDADTEVAQGMYEAHLNQHVPGRRPRRGPKRRDAHVPYLAPADLQTRAGRARPDQYPRLPHRRGLPLPVHGHIVDVNVLRVRYVKARLPAEVDDAQAPPVG